MGMPHHSPLSICHGLGCSASFIPATPTNPCAGPVVPQAIPLRDKEPAAQTLEANGSCLSFISANPPSLPTCRAPLIFANTIPHPSNQSPPRMQTSPQVRWTLLAATLRAFGASSVGRATD